MNEVVDFWRDATNEKWHALDHPRLNRLRPTYRLLLDKAIAVLGYKPKTAIDWGAGGGLAAGMLQDGGCHVYGVDIVKRSGPFEPVLVDIDNPEACVAGKKVDLFVCLTVIQHMPDVTYANRIVRLAADVLVPGGVALFQIRTGKPSPQITGDSPYKVGWNKRVVIAPADFRQTMEDAGFTIREADDGTKSWASDYHYMIGQI